MASAKEVFEKRFQGSMFEEWIENRLCIFWKGYVLHGQYQIYDSMQKHFGYSHPNWMSQVNDLLVGMVRLEILKPLRYRPSKDRAAFGGFQGGTAKTEKPNLMNAMDWEYEVIQ